MTDPSNFRTTPGQFSFRPIFAAAIIVVVAVAIAVGGIFVKTRDQIQKDKLELVADSNAKQVAPVRRVIQLRLAQDKARLIQFAATRSALGPGRARTFGDFGVVSLLTMGADGQWSIAWIEKGPLNPQTPGQSQSPEITLLKSLPYDRIREGDLHWQRLSDSEGRPLWALAISVETQTGGNAIGAVNGALPEGLDYHSVQVGTGGRAVVIGFFARNPLTSATEDFIGSTSTAFVIDSRGYVASHSNKSMVGALLREDPSVQEIFQARSSAGATRYETPAGVKVFSAFEQVDRSNLYVVMSTPETVAGAVNIGFGKTAIAAGALAAIVGLLLVFAWGAKLLPRVGAAAGPPPRLAMTQVGTMVSPASSGPQSGPVAGAVSRRTKSARGGEESSADEIPALELLELPAEMTRRPVPSQVAATESAEASDGAARAKDVADFVAQLVQGLESSMKEPLLAALAHVQLAKAKSNDKGAAGSESQAEIADHVASVERDLRRAKETIDELSRMSTEAKPPSATELCDLKAVATGVLSRQRSALEAAGVTVKEKLADVPQVRGREASLVAVFEEILLNAKRSLSGRDGKQLSIALEDSGNSILLTVADNGIGMDRETRARVFDPFFMRFEDSAAKGLGLTRVKAVMQGHGGRCDLSSSPGDGTRISLQWPVPAIERAAYDKRQIERQQAKQREDAKAAELAATAANGAGTGKSPPPPPPPPGGSAKTHDESLHGLSVSMMTTGLDFSSEGAVALGGRAPLPADKAKSLPPPPRPGEDPFETEEEESWMIADPAARLNSANLSSAQAEQEAIMAKETEDTVTIRPVRRG